MPGAPLVASRVVAAVVVLCVLFLTAVAAEVVLDDSLHPRSKFGYLLGSVLLSGLGATYVLEKLETRVFTSGV